VAKLARKYIEDAGIVVVKLDLYMSDGGIYASWALDIPDD